MTAIVRAGGALPSVEKAWVHLEAAEHEGRMSRPEGGMPVYEWRLRFANGEVSFVLARTAAGAAKWSAALARVHRSPTTSIVRRGALRGEALALYRRASCP